MQADVNLKHNMEDVVNWKNQISWMHVPTVPSYTANEAREPNVVEQLCLTTAVEIHDDL